MEMQVIYSSLKKRNFDKSAVLVFLFEKKAGFFNKFLDDIDFYDLPNRENKTKNILNKLFIPKIFNNNNKAQYFNKDEMASAKLFSYYTYEGSLTQPPCSEYPLYYVASEPLPVAVITGQLAQEALKSQSFVSKGFGSENSEDQEFLESKSNKSDFCDKTLEDGNYRKTHKLNGRKVNFYDLTKFSNNLSNMIVKIPLNEGHIEKMKIRKNEVIFIQGDKPSGIPGAVVIGGDDLLS
jgi:hypothetical protein